jgi:hypothetical protein
MMRMKCTHLDLAKIRMQSYGLKDPLSDECDVADLTDGTHHFEATYDPEWRWPDIDCFARRDNSATKLLLTVDPPASFPKQVALRQSWAGPAARSDSSSEYPARLGQN